MSTRRASGRLPPIGFALGVLTVLPACITPSVVASEGRAPRSGLEELAWSPARAVDFAGLFESVRIEGTAAAAIGKLYYHFSPDGTYTGAALVFDAGRPAFLTLGGSWTLSDEMLDLGDGQPARASSTLDHLRLETPDGIACLRRVPIE